MNSTDNTTQPRVLPSPPAGGEAMPGPDVQPRKTKPTDREIVAACDDLIGDVFFLRQAAMVLDEYANSEFKSGKILGDGIFLCRLGREQVEGIQYMLMHVRDLADKLEEAISKAFGLKGGAR